MAEKGLWYESRNLMKTTGKKYNEDSQINNAERWN